MDCGSPKHAVARVYIEESGHRHKISSGRRSASLSTRRHHLRASCGYGNPQTCAPSGAPSSLARYLRTLEPLQSVYLSSSRGIMSCRLRTLICSSLDEASSVMTIERELIFLPGSCESSPSHAPWAVSMKIMRWHAQSWVGRGIIRRAKHVVHVSSKRRMTTAFSASSSSRSELRA